jgi:lipoprotein LprG
MNARISPPTGQLLSGVVVVASFLLTACAGGSDAAAEPTGPTVPAEVQEIITASASAMGGVTSVRFDLTRSGSRVYIDQFESIAIDRIVGEFSVPQSAQAVLDVEVNNSLKTQLAAIALADEVWLSNPITGDYETLPPGYDIDPSAFFDPKNGWQPLMENLTDPTLIGIEKRDGQQRYHVRGTATKEQMKIITAGLVRNQDVVIDFWIHPVTALVRSVEFTNDLGDGDINWFLELSQYGEDFSIEPPAGVAT